MTTMNRLTPDALLAHEGFVRRIARSLTHDESSGLDLSQDALMAALESPPVDRGVRGWLATVMRNRGREQARTDHGRRLRERAASKAESVSLDAAAPLERVELNQTVIEAVLALEEPYRAVVVAVYYEGLTPAEVAQREGTKAATVRSQLCRAHGRLKRQLDRRYGERNLWAVPLMLPWTRHPGRGAADAGTRLGLWASGGGALVAATAAAVVVWGPRGGAASSAGIPPVPRSAGAVASVGEANPSLAQVPSGSTRELVESEPQVAEGTTSLLPPVQGVPALLQRTRQIRAELVGRALKVDPVLEERFAWLGEDGGVIRLLDRESFGSDWTVPWLRGGGSYYSFNRRSYDGKGQAQVAYDSGTIWPFGTGIVGLFLEGMPLKAVPATEEWSGPPLESADAALWELAWREVLPHGEGLGTFGRTAWMGHGTHVGSSYLLRVRQQNQHDLLVAYEVLAIGDDGCTVAWRLLKEWPVQGDSLHRPPSVRHRDVGLGPAALRTLTEPELRAEHDFVLQQADEALFQSFPRSIEDAFGGLRTEPGAGLARLLEMEGPWCELKAGEGHGSHLSPLDGTHDTHRPYLGYRADGPRGKLTPSMSGSVFGAVCDLGPVPLDEVTLAAAGTYSDSKARMVFDPRFGGERPPNGDSAEAHAPVVPGHTYLVRSVRRSDRNVLLAVHVAGRDTYGVIVAWRVLHDGPGWAR